MLTGFVSPSRPILMLVFLLLGAKGVGTGSKELREGISSGDPKAKVPEDEKIRGEAHTGLGAETVRTAQRSL